MRRKDVTIVFSFTRAYFMVDMEVPSAYVRFLLSIMPGKSSVDLYAMLGLQKQAKTLIGPEKIPLELYYGTKNILLRTGVRCLMDPSQESLNELSEAGESTRHETIRNYFLARCRLAAGKK